MASPRTKLRLFVAAYPPPAFTDSVLEQLRTLGLPDHREVAPEQVHLTLQFIGDTDVRELERVKESVERSCSGIPPVTLTPERLVTLPNRGPPRLVACETDAPGDLLEIHRRLAHRLARRSRENASDRFLPHLTLCRFARTARAHTVDLPVEIDPFTIDVVRLMRSRLMPGGAEHVEVAAYELSA